MNRFREREKEKKLNLERRALLASKIFPQELTLSSFSKDSFLEGIPNIYTEESPLIVDNSILSTFATCHTEALISYHHNLVSNTDSNSLQVGRATHKALEHFFKGGEPKEAMKIFKEVYYPAGNSLAPESYLSWENTSVTFETWLAGHSLDSLSYKPLPGTIEGAIISPLWPERWGKRVLYLGLIDLLVEDKATRTLAIMDHKSTSKRLDDSWTNQFKTSSQISGYIWLAQRAKIQEKLNTSSPINSAYINTIQFSKLPVSERKCPKHSVAYSICKGLHALARLDGPFMRSPLQLSQWLNEARDLTEMWAQNRESFGDLKNLRGAGKRGLFQYEACKFCSFQDFCAGTIQDPQRLPEFFKNSKWEPWKETPPGA